MKKFIFHSIVFILLCVALFHIKPFYLLYHNHYQQVVAGQEIYYAIAKSKVKSKSKKVLFGDSVARQLFDSKDSDSTINSLASNQAIGMVGQFFLLQNYLNAGNNIDTVYFLFRPFTFQNNLNQVYTYHYFLKPFYNKEYNQYFTTTVLKQIEKIPYYQFCRYPSILTSNWAPNFSPKDTDNHSFLSPVSLEYLRKIKELSWKYNFTIIIIPTPMNNIYQKQIQGFDTTGIASTGLQSEFKNYFTDIIYLDNSQFVDSSHLIKPEVYTQYYKTKFIK